MRNVGGLSDLTKVIYVACMTLHVLELLISPPSRYPDIFPVLNVLISTPVFVLVWLWSIRCGVETGWALGGLPGSSHAVKANPCDSTTMNYEWKGSGGDQVDGLRRDMGARAVSLGFSQARRRGSYRPASVGPEVR